MPRFGPTAALAAGFAFFGLVGEARGATPWSYAIPTTARDVTPRLDAWRKGDGFDQPAIRDALKRAGPKLATINLLIVPGFLTDFIMPARGTGAAGYLGAQETALTGMVASVKLVPVNTQSSSSTNAKIIGESIAASKGPVCLISHSKGGLDVLEFLLGATAAQRKKVLCWVAMQAPFAGSPIAQEVSDYGALAQVSRVLLTLMGGTGDALADLTVMERARYLKDHDDAIRTLARDIPILSVTSSVEGKVSFEDYGPVSRTLLWMRDNGIQNDGLVPTTSAVLPYSRYVTLDSVDHIGAVSPGTRALSEDRRQLLTQALITLVLETR